MLLKHLAVEKAARKDKAYDLRDGKGLSLHVAPTGTKAWRYRYEWSGKSQLLTLGRYPEMSLAAARDARIAAEAVLRSGRHPGQHKKEEKAAQQREQNETFEAIAREWHNKQKVRWSEKHAEGVMKNLERYVFPEIGPTPIRELTRPSVLAALQKIERRPAVEMAHRMRQKVSQVFRYAMASDIVAADPAEVVGDALTPVIKRRMPAVTTLEEARTVVQEVIGTKAEPMTKLAMLLLALTVVRPGCLSTTPWSEFAGLSDIDPEWAISPQRLKLTLANKNDANKTLIVPLARQAIEIIGYLRELTQFSPFVFPNARWIDKPMSENALLYLMQRTTYRGRHVPHGWRSTFSTVMNDLYPEHSKVIDMMLAHVPKDKVESAYNRAQYMKHRRRFAQEWADMLLDGVDLRAALLGDVAAARMSIRRGDVHRRAPRNSSGSRRRPRCGAPALLLLDRISSSLRRDWLPQRRNLVMRVERNEHPDARLTREDHGAEFMTIEEVCRMVKASRATIYRWMSTGEFPVSRRFGRQMRRWHRRDVEAWLLGRPQAAIRTAT